MARVGIIQGLKGWGKTLFLATGSKAMPDTMDELFKAIAAGQVIDASDVLIIQLDAEGDLGLQAASIQCTVEDLIHLRGNWPGIMLHLDKVSKVVKKAGTFTVVGVDFGAMVDCAVAHYSDPTLKSKNAWTDAAQAVEDSLSQFRALPGVTLVLMVHLKEFSDAFFGGKDATQQQKDTHAAKLLMKSDGNGVDFVPEVTPSALKPFKRDASFIWTRRRLNENKIVNGKATIVSKYWVDTVATDFASSFTRGQLPGKQIFEAAETRTLKSMLAVMDSFSTQRKGIKL